MILSAHFSKLEKRIDDIPSDYPIEGSIDGVPYLLISAPLSLPSSHQHRYYANDNLNHPNLLMPTTVLQNSEHKLLLFSLLGLGTPLRDFLDLKRKTEQNLHFPFVSFLLRDLIFALKYVTNSFISYFKILDLLT